MQLKWHDPRASIVEGIASRGDRRIGAGHRGVWRRGGVFQEWGEHFRLDLWLEAMAAHGLDVDWYVHRHRTEDEVLPWDHLSAGLHKDFLWQDWRDALDRAGPPGLPLDALLRLRRLHRLRHRARRGLGHRRRPAAARAPARTSRRGGEVPVQLLARGR